MKGGYIMKAKSTVLLITALMLAAVTLVAYSGSDLFFGGAEAYAGNQVSEKLTKNDGQSMDKNEASNMEKTHMETAMFGAGCFWGVEATFRQIEGVKATAVGYSGGHMENPSYQDVCTGTTGHAEVVQVTYDPAKVSYETLLNVFWENHDPTTLNRQGPDHGEQYRSAIFYTNDEQKKIAEDSKAALEKSGIYKKPIVTEITKAGPFYKAEEYHQQYLEKRGLSTCHIK